MRVVLLGVPGAGKGTQGHRLADHFALPMIASGDIFRSHVQRGTPLGREANRYMEAGELVPDDTVISMVLERIAEADTADGFILDGFPRTMTQAQALDESLADQGRPLSAVLDFVLPDEMAIARLTARLICPNCQRTYNVLLQPPRVEGVCDACGTALTGRSDDDIATARHRLEVYHQGTEKLELYFLNRDLLRRVDASGLVDEVTSRAIAALGGLATG